MKKWIFALATGAFFLLPSCNKGPSCPAYNGLHSTGTPTYAIKKDGEKAGDNKKEIEKQKDDELGKPPKRKNAYSLFPQGMR